jgi:predicted rRNA methylase YqxC with S4 and FtsJ domains
MCARPRFRDVLSHVRAVRPEIQDPLAAIGERRVLVDGVIVMNAHANVRADASVVVRDRRPLAGRRKLDAALTAFRVDVGFGQLRGALRVDPRVICLERTNLADVRRHLPADDRIDVLTADLSFISLTDAMPQVRDLRFTPGAVFLGLVKPQFELGLRGRPTDELELERAFGAACRGVSRAGWTPLAGMRSSIAGGHGSREFFLLASWRGSDRSK